MIEWKVDIDWKYFHGVLHECITNLHSNINSVVKENIKQVTKIIPFPT